MRVARIATALAVLLLVRPASSADIVANDGVVLLPSDETIAPFNRPFNLTGKTVTFTPASESFRADAGPLQFDEDKGTRLSIDPASKSATTVLRFDFPFLGTNVRTLYVSQLLAIYLDPPPPPYPFRFTQYGDAEWIAHTNGRRVIAPLLTSTRSQGGAFRPPEVWVRETGDRAVITWHQAERGLAVQTVLDASGTIRFSYRNIANTRGGVLIVTSGAEAWRTPAIIATASDPESDVVGPASAPMFDMTGLVLSRLGPTNVLQLAIETKAPIDRSALAGGDFVAAQIEFGPPPFTAATIDADPANDSLRVRSWQSSGSTPAVRVDGDTIVLTFSQEHALGAGTFDGEVKVTLYNLGATDSATFRARIEPAQQPARTDFATTTSNQFNGPVSDAFTIPVFDDEAAWERVRQALRLDPQTIDAVLAYQNFYTDAVFQSGAYAVPGNPGVDGIHGGSPPPSTQPRRPNLLNLSRIGYSHNALDPFAAQVAMHELGHRWLFGIQAIDDRGNVIVLGDSAGHPVSGLNTPAAFPVLHGFDCSVMGGFTFHDNGNGTFAAAGIDEDDCGYGYSWLDLYAMGLAGANEVPPFFYLTDADPPISFDTLFAGPVRATRHDLTMSNVVARLGPRAPAWPDTQRQFRLVFVLVYDLEQPLPESDIAAVRHYANLLQSRFATATGRRGAIENVFPSAPGRRRAAGK